jgi:lipid A 4'-phosphatase
VRYLRTFRARLVLLCFLASSLLLVAFPEVDLIVSALFFDNGFTLVTQSWTKLLHEAVGVSIAVSMLAVVGTYAFNRLCKQNVCGIDGRKILYLFLVLILGAGLLVNATLKDNFGRVRPRDVQEFGGSRHFTPAFVVTNGCVRNCSFSSGDAAGAFFFLAFTLAVSRRRAIAMAAVAFGVAVSFSRIAIGAHFLSDTVVSFFIMLLVSDVLYFYMFVPADGPVGHVAAARPALGIEA